jgi:hypothetical protein
MNEITGPVNRDQVFALCLCRGKCTRILFGDELNPGILYSEITSWFCIVEVSVGVFQLQRCYGLRIVQRVWWLVQL